MQQSLSAPGTVFVKHRNLYPHTKQKVLKLKIAVQNSFPNRSITAEREFIARILTAGRSLGWIMEEVITSDEIYALEPDAVIVTHEFTPKLTKFPTLGVIWSPVAFFGHDTERVRNVLSYDGYLVATQSLREYVQTLLSGYGKLAPISEFEFLPTALGDVDVTPFPSDVSLFYAGVHWDGNRHGGLFGELKGKFPLSIYGDAKKWKFAGNDYRGTIPFDGRSVAKEIARCGAALSLHTPTHRGAGVPSMRLFEAASAGAVVISDRIAFAEREFGDSLLYVDTDTDAPTTANQIVAHMDWVRTHPVKAKALARRAQDIFLQRFTLEGQLTHFPDFIESVQSSMAHKNEPEHGLVEVIVRIGSRPAEVVRRALQSIANQTYPRIGLILVSLRDGPNLDEVQSEFKGRFEHIRNISAPTNGYRSTVLWAGLQAAEGKFLCNLDDGDTMHPTHVASQVSCLVNHSPQPILAYSGAIEVQEECDHWFDAPNFSGDIQCVIKERRRLLFLEPSSHKRMLRFDNFILSHAWMIRTNSLTKDLLVDPEMKFGEDVALYMMFMERGLFAPTWRATVDCSWRSTSKNNLMFTSELRAGSKQVFARLRAVGNLPKPEHNIMWSIIVCVRSDWC